MEENWIFAANLLKSTTRGAGRWGDGTSQLMKKGGLQEQEVHLRRGSRYRTSYEGNNILEFVQKAR